MVNPRTLHLPVKVFATASEAITAGYDYAAQPGTYTPVEVETVVVVMEGTLSGNSTVDFIVRDDTGRKFVFIVTSALLGMVSNL